MKSIYKLEISKKQIKILIDDILHLSIKQEELIAIQSWIMGYGPEAKYHIEFTTKTQAVNSEYDNIEKWKNILNLLNENELYGSF